MLTEQKRERIEMALNAFRACKPYNVEFHNGYVSGLIDAWGGDCTISSQDIFQYTRARIEIYEEKKAQKQVD